MLQLIDRSEDLMVAALPQDVDFCTSDDVRAAGERLLTGDCRYLVLDSSPFTFMDSSGITALLAFWRRLEAAGGALIVAVPDEHLRWRLGLLGLDTVLMITVTLGEAITQARRLRDSKRSSPSTRQPAAETKSA
ncbi:STAS domain-containing protein [Streptomyces lavendofoliae]|uniref:STAS domain-containing protein n=1 Tax=Streptomyces lavendofoliae TaxID=67314 RepID=UPI003D8DB714